MHNIVKYAIVTNLIVALLFVWTSYAIASDFSEYPNDLVMVRWNFFGWFDIYHAGGLVNGEFQPVGAHHLWFDFPFWLFFVALFLNFCFLWRLSRTVKPL